MAEDLGFLREVQDAVRAERAERFVTRYGKWLIAGSIGVVLATAGSVAWQAHMQSLHADMTQVLIDAAQLAASGKPAEGAQKLEDLSHASGPLAQMAAINRAAMLGDTGNGRDALSSYREAIKTPDGNKTLSDLAVLHAVVLADNQNIGQDIGDADTIGRPYATPLREITASRLIRLNDRKNASAILEPIIPDPDADPEPGAALKDLAGAAQ